MKVGFALSPGGLLLPYHAGVLHCLQYEGQLTSTTPVAGSSAGAIASMAHGCGIDMPRVLEATIQVSDQANAMGGARGRLLPLLQQQMDDLVGHKEFEHLTADQEESTCIGIAYQEIFPSRQSVLQSKFVDRHDLFQAVQNSCMFPFFATNWPCLWDRRNQQRQPSLWKSRLVMDGFFSVPRERFGCPDFDYATCTIATEEEENEPLNNDQQQSQPKQLQHPLQVDRTIAISVFPPSKIKMTAFDTTFNVIAPPDHVPIETLFRLATQSSSRQELTQIFELGYQTAEEWCRNEEQRQRQQQQQQDEEVEEEALL